MHTSQDTIDNRRNDASSHFPSPMRLGRAQLHAALGALVLLGTLFAATAGCDKKGLPAAPPDGAEDSSPCVLFVTAPSGGDTLVVGQQYSLEWAVSDCGDRVKIELWQAGEPVAAIANFSKNDGDYTWTAAQVDSATDDYQVRVEDLTSGSDAFSEAFTIAVPPVNEEDPPACTIAVTSPDGGESWTVGTEHEITWDVSDCGGGVAIELWQDGDLVDTLSNETTNDGSYMWTAEQFGGQSANYRIRIRDLSSGAADESDGVFSVPVPDAECQVRVLAPNGGESWTAGTTHTIRWDVSDCGAMVRIELWRAGDLAQVLTNQTGNDGTHSWTVAQVDGATSNYRIRIIDLESDSWDESDSAFSIVDTPACDIAMLDPNGGEVLTEGQTYTLNWERSDCGGLVSLELLRDATVVRSIAAGTANDGTHTWTPTRDGTATDGYRVRVTDLVSGATDTSDAAFSIVEPGAGGDCTLTVTYPDGGEELVEGSEYSISWNRSDCGAEVALELWRGGEMVSTIAASTANDGSYGWIASQDGGATTGYRILVRDLDSGVEDMSDDTFQIPDDVPSPDDYYCVKIGGTRTSGRSTGDISAFGWANADCYGTIAAAVAEMGPGDQVWVDDGTYEEDVNLRVEKSGSASDYTVVRARNAGRATLLNQDYTINLRGTSYVEVMGFRVIDSALAPIYVHDSAHHFKFFRISWNGRTGLVTDGSHHGLLEDCYAYGGPHRYAFQVSNGANNIIFRRCLVRWDFSLTQEPQGCFASYTCDKIYYQNCISIDGTDNKGIDTPNVDGLKSYFTPNGSTDCHYEGCISIAMQGAAGWWLEGTTAIGTLTDCIAWNHLTNAADETDTYDPYSFASTADVGSWSLRNCTFGINNLGRRPVTFDMYNDESMRDCIIMSMTLDSGQYAVSDHLDDGDYNVYWGNTGGRNIDGSMGSHSRTDINPLTSGLVSPVEVQLGSVLGSAGEGGGRVGARIVTKIGASGSLVGESGWDQDTGESLWPWPYEDQIREDCSQFNMSAGEAYPGSPVMNGARGFCAPGQTLTNYVLNYPLQ